MDKLFLIDGNSFCYRAFYAIRDLSTSKGEPTNAIYGFTTMLSKIIKDYNPQYLAIAFDLKEPTFRHKRYKEYKIHRKPMPDDLVSQIPTIKEVLSCYGYAIYEKPGFEADDILATIVKKMKKETIEVCIITGDKDTLQLVGEHVRVLNPHKDNLLYDAETVKEHFGVKPSQISELLSLMGDASDNIPGVPGIGEKTAVSLINEFGTVKDIYRNLARVKKEHIRKTLEANTEKLELSKELTTMDSDVPIEVDLDSMRIGEPDTNRLYDLFKRLEFKNLAREFIPHASENKNHDYKLITQEKDFQSLLNKLKKADEFTFDFETTSRNPTVAKIVGISFCLKEAESFYVPVMGKKIIKNALKELKPIFEDPGIKKIGQNIKYEKIILKKEKIDLKGIIFDTMLASYLLNPSEFRHDLDSLALEFLDYKKISIDELIGKGKKQLRMDEVDIEKVCEYGCEDSDITFRLKNILLPKLEQKNLYKLFLDVELPLVDVLADMELDGVCIDVEFLKKMSGEMTERLNTLEKDIYEIAGCEFNINSPKQLSEVLFVKLKLPVIKKTKTGASTDASVLGRLALEHALPKAILEYRELSKLKSTYIDALPELINQETGKVNASFNQAVTATGRLSSSEPNLQNIPIKTDVGKKIRKAFIPSFKNGVILSADYSQIELRILAHLSNDETLIDAFNRDADIHTFTASLIFDCEELDVSKKMRSQAKTVNFGIVYGMSPYGLSRELEIPPDEAKQFIDAYFERYPKVYEYMKEQIELARDEGYVCTMLNRRRYIQEINSKNQNIRMFAERTAINTPIQGSAADIIKMAMIKIHSELKKKKLKCMMVMQVHDELVFDLPRHELKKATTLIRSNMEEVVRLKVPIKVNITHGKNWLEAE